MTEFWESSMLLFNNLLEKLVSYKRISGACADEAKWQYSHFLNVIVKENKEKFLLFDVDEDRVDAFLMKYLVLLPSSFGSLTKVVKTLLILSHGQAQVERGFSINSEFLVDNQSNESLIAQHIKTDHMTQKGLQSHEVNITQALLKHVKCARSRYF